MSNSFKSLGLSPESLGAVRRARFAAPTPIQAQAIPPALSGRDVIGCAVTGTGKTAAYLLPLVERLAGQPGPAGLVLAPTRELVQQIAGEAAFFGEPRGVSRAVVIGGTDMGAQVEALRQRPSLILATPGRLADLLASGALSLSTVRMLVLDEADRMLEMGFMPELERILAALPRERQTLLFSATLGHNVTRFAQEVLRRPVRVEVTPSGTPAARAVQRMYELDAPGEKYALLLSLLGRDQLSTLVFTRTRERAEKVQERLKDAGYKTAIIHSDRTQGQRRQALDGFRKGQYRCLVATDIASRGLDVDDIGHVINFDLPFSPEDYVHRIGRTARAGASGRASTFVTERDAETVIAIERIIRMPVPRAEVPRTDPIFLDALEEFQGDEEEAARPVKKPAAPSRPRVASRGMSKARGGEDRRREAPGRGGRSMPARRGEGGRGRDSTRGEKGTRSEKGTRGEKGTRSEKGTRGRSTGPGRSGPRGAARPGGKGGGRRGAPPRGAGSPPRGRGGGGRRSR